MKIKYYELFVLDKNGKELSQLTAASLQDAHEMLTLLNNPLAVVIAEIQINEIENHGDDTAISRWRNN